MYYLIEEASGALCAFYCNLHDAIKEAEKKKGKYIVTDDTGIIYYDTQPGVTYKI